MRVTCVVPCYNYDYYLAECLTSLVNQTEKCEIIVVDDGSTDKTKEVASQFPVKYVYQENKGLSGARNTGIKLAQTEKVFCLDADDKVDKLYVEKCSKYPGVVVTGIQHFGGFGWGAFPNTDFMRMSDFLLTNRIHCASMFDKKDWEAVGGYDEQMKEGYEDWEFWIRLKKLGCRITCIKELLFYYRVHGDSMSFKSRRPETDARIRKYIREKHSDLYSPLIGGRGKPDRPRIIGGNCEFCGTNNCEHIKK